MALHRVDPKIEVVFMRRISLSQLMRNIQNPQMCSDS
jgi:hypothetical protein